MLATRNSLLGIISPWWTQPDFLVVAFIVIFVLLSWQPSNMDLDWSRHSCARSSVPKRSRWMWGYFTLGLIGAALYLMLD